MLEFDYAALAVIALLMLAFLVSLYVDLKQGRKTSYKPPYRSY